MNDSTVFVIFLAESQIQKPRLPPLSEQSIDYYVKQTAQYKQQIMTKQQTNKVRSH